MTNGRGCLHLPRTGHVLDVDGMQCQGWGVAGWAVCSAECQDFSFWSGSLLQAKCHVRLKPSKDPDHNQALPCQRCTAASKDTYGQHCVVYHGVDGHAMRVWGCPLQSFSEFLLLSGLVAPGNHALPHSPFPHFYIVDLLPTSVALNILGRLPGKLQMRVLVCAARQQTPEPIVAGVWASRPDEAPCRAWARG